MHRLLPSTYRVWKIASVKQCGDEKFYKNTYNSPTGHTVSLLEVNYKERIAFERVQTPMFITYKTVILGLFITAMTLEFKQIFVILNWCIKYPNADDFAEPVLEEKDEGDGHSMYTIQGVQTSHRIIVTLITITRLGMLACLTVVGVVFLNKQVDYVGLLLDGIAMLFILEISEILYTQVLRKSVQSQTENVTPMRFPAIGIDFLNKRPALRQILWLGFIFLATSYMCYDYNVTVAKPLSHSLACACSGEGEKCYETTRFSKEYWTDYWQNTLPDSLEKIKNLEPAGGISDESPSYLNEGRRAKGKRRRSRNRLSSHLHGVPWR